MLHNDVTPCLSVPFCSSQLLAAAIWHWFFPRVANHDSATVVVLSATPNLHNSQHLFAVALQRDEVSARAGGRRAHVGRLGDMFAGINPFHSVGGLQGPRRL